MRNQHIVLTISLTILAIALAGCAGVIDSEGAKIGDPKRFAEATHIARMSDESVQATSTAVSLQTTRMVADISAQATRTAADIAARATDESTSHEKAKADSDKVSAQATVALAKAKTEVEAQPAEARGKAMAYLLSWAGLGAGALVLMIGLAFGIVAWVNKRATSVYPNKAGQFPVIITKGPGYVALHDPNRGLGPGAIIRTPGLIERAAYGIAMARGNAPVLEPGAEYPQTASEPAMLQIGVGAQAVQNEVAKQSGRPKLLFWILPIGAQPAGDRWQTRTMVRMPQIAVINDPKQIADFEQKLLSDGSDE